MNRCPDKRHRHERIITPQGLHQTYPLAQIERVSIDLSGYPFLPAAASQQKRNNQSSLLSYGVIHPPLLVRKLTTDRHGLLNGLDLLTMAERFHLTTVPAYVLPQNIAPQKLFCLIYLYKQQDADKSSIIDDALLLQQASRAAAGQGTDLLLECMGYSRHQGESLMQLLELEDSVIASLHSGMIQPRAGTKLLRFSRKEQKFLNNIIAAFRFGASKQSKLIDLTYELGKREQISAIALLEAWQPSLADKANKPQLGAQLLNHLKTLCSPQLSRAKMEFQHYVNSLQLGSNMTVTASPSFERDELTLSLTFANKAAFEEVLPLLKKIT
ncbi:MAG: hypothetical protein CSA32_00515 [Desulfobulbus propionicus]|nr:MAG: hypothetical protein CSA32_00515 [Desulfobulbus propionicus]